MVKMVKYQILPLCSRCNSYDVRESSDLSTIETLIGLFGIRPYRCKKCGERFWRRRKILRVMSRWRMIAVPMLQTMLKVADQEFLAVL